MSSCNCHRNCRNLVDTSEEKYLIYNPINDSRTMFNFDHLTIDFWNMFKCENIYFFNLICQSNQKALVQTIDFCSFSLINDKNISDIQCCCFKIPSVIIFKTSNDKKFEYYDIDNKNCIDIGPFVGYVHDDILEYHEELKMCCVKNLSYENHTNENECCVCFQQIKQKVACIPCGHTQFCEECLMKVSCCPLCKTKYTQILKIKFYNFSNNK
jgi:hypothetical protein